MHKTKEDHLFALKIKQFFGDYMNEWEANFVKDTIATTFGLSEKQRNKLKDIKEKYYHKLFEAEQFFEKIPAYLLSEVKVSLDNQNIYLTFIVTFMIASNSP